MRFKIKKDKQTNKKKSCSLSGLPSRFTDSWFSRRNCVPSCGALASLLPFQEAMHQDAFKGKVQMSTLARLEYENWHFTHTNACRDWGKFCNLSILSFFTVEANMHLHYIALRLTWKRHSLFQCLQPDWFRWGRKYYPSASPCFAVEAGC